MREDLEQLVQLQKLETDLKRTRGEMDEVPRRKAQLESELATERSRLDTAKAALDDSLKARRRFESDLADLESKRSRYKGQLMEVKTNKEYTAMLHEIEGVEREIRGREDQILAEMEKAETGSAEVKTEEALFKSHQERLKVDVAALDARARALDEDVRRLTTERDRVAGAIPEDTLTLFQRVARLRGSGVAEARDGMCQVCHVKLRLQMFVEIKRNDQIFQCPACNRILYFEPPVPVSAPHP